MLEKNNNKINKIYLFYYDFVLLFKIDGKN